VAKRSISKAIRLKSHTAYPTNGAKPSTIRAIHKLGPKPMIMPKSDDEHERVIHGGYRGKSCKVCFVKFSKIGACNCT